MAEMVTLRIEQEEVAGKGWIVRAPAVCATAQGVTLEEATANLLDLIEQYWTPPPIGPLGTRRRAVKGRGATK